MTTKSRKRILIIGGVAGGASAAARARRLSEEAEIILFERGPYISFANCGLPYHISGIIADRKRLLVQTVAKMKQRFQIDVRILTEVIKIDPLQKEIHVRNVSTGEASKEKYDQLILSPGAEPVRPAIPGSEVSRIVTLRSMADMDKIKAFLTSEKPDHTVIIGGGYIGLEMAEALRRQGLAVTLVEMSDQVMNTLDPEMATPIHQHLTLHGVDLRLKATVVGFEEEKNSMDVLLNTGETLPCQMTLLAVGVKPEISLAQAAGLKIGKSGGIVTDHHMRTSQKDIFAIGDAAEVIDFVSGEPAVIPLAGPANRQGRLTADAIFHRDHSYRGTLGTAICKVFDLSAASTGLNEKRLKQLGKPYEKIYLHPADHATYYPGATPIHMKLLFNPENGSLLGAQAVGLKGIDKRIDILAVAIRAGLTVYDLEELELCYAPPYGSAKDPINYAGFVAANILRGDVKICHVDSVLNLQKNRKVLDVRTEAEIRHGAIPGALSIPLDELRGRLGELSKNHEWIVSCQVGMRGYTACRILMQHGYKCRNLSGGYITYQAVISTGYRTETETKETQHDTGEQENGEST